MRMRLGMGMAVRMFMRAIMRMVFMVRRQMHIKPGALDAGSLGARDVNVIPFQVQPGQFVFQAGWVQSEVKEGSDEHVAADPAE